MACAPPSRHPVQEASTAVIDFTLTDEQRLVRDAARAFAEAEILPYIRDWDQRYISFDGLA